MKIFYLKNWELLNLKTTINIKSSKNTKYKNHNILVRFYILRIDFSLKNQYLILLWNTRKMYCAFNLEGIYTLFTYTLAESIHIILQFPPLSKYSSFLWVYWKTASWRNQRKTKYTIKTAGSKKHAEHKVIQKYRYTSEQW